jgi:metal-responsive CopG/Arc/MetJ family transcriptional regulator
MSTTIRTAISIQKSLFDQVESLAQQLNISRSHLFELALEMFIKNHQNQALLDEINQAYADEPDPDEKMRLSQMRAQQRKLVEKEW